jgi:hypothetical protein
MVVLQFIQMNIICDYFEITLGYSILKESDIASVSKLLRDSTNIIFILRHTALCFYKNFNLTIY